MNLFLYKTGRLVYQKFPGLQPFIRSAYIRFFARLNFIGWGISTEHQVPWEDEYDWKSFRDACKELKQHFELTQSAPSSPVNTDDLKWRHWVVAFAVRKAIKFVRTDHYDFAECGVGDGLTSFFALNEIEHNGILGKSTMHLYDSWQKMDKERLTDSELANERKYENLDLQRTQRNLYKFNDHIQYHVGYIPDSLAFDPPESIVFLHIDLNSSAPTLASLEFFLPRLIDNGIIVFDDYGFLEYSETKKLVDKFFSDKSGVLEKLPTGQAIYYHRKI